MTSINFGPFHLDTSDQTLWRGDECLRISPKEFAILHLLVDRPGRLVTKVELFDRVWPDANVGEGVLKVAIGKLRKALGDDVAAPRYIVTAHRRGYRFVGEIATAPRTAPAADDAPPASTRFTGAFGREGELALLGRRLGRVLGGRREMVFVTGEPGIGKTTFVDAFLRQAVDRRGILVGRGQCLEHQGAGEPFLPVLEALTRLARCDTGGGTVELLAQHAPTWLSQMPSLVSPAEREALRASSAGATRQRMLRELGELVDALAAAAPIVLVIEDLHWSDGATVDLLSYLARRPDPARLLVLATFRPTEVMPTPHPLAAAVLELQVHRLCHEIPLSPLPLEAIEAYLAARFAPNAFEPWLAAMAHRRTEGNPLFLVTLLDDLFERGWLALRDGRFYLDAAPDAVEDRVPRDLERLVETQLERLSEPERRALEAASVAGAEFSAAAIGAALDQAALPVEEVCDALAHRGALVRRAGDAELPGGAPTSRYAFLHAVYQKVLYERVSVTRRVLLHRRLGAWGAELHGDDAVEAATLAMHFERGRDAERAIHHLRRSAEHASRLHPSAESLAYLRRALALCDALPAGEGALMRATLHERLGVLRRSMDDMRGAAEEFEAEAACARAAGDRVQEVRALLHLAHAVTWFDRPRCLAVGEEALAVATFAGEGSVVVARGFLGAWRLQLHGWSDGDAQSIRDALELARRDGDEVLLGAFLGFQSLLLCVTSEYQAACDAAAEGIVLNRAIGDAYGDLSCQFFRAYALLHLGRWSEMVEAVESALALARRNEHELGIVLFQLLSAWLHLQAGDWAPAHALAEPLRPALESSGIESSPLDLALLLLGRSYLAMRRLDDAYACYEALERRLEQEHRVELLFRVLWQLGMSRYWLVRGDLCAAREAAEETCRLAGGLGERTYAALGARLLCEIARAEGDDAAAVAAISRALAAVEHGDAPLAAWRVHATAAALHAGAGRHADAAWFRARGADVLHRIADASPEALRRRLLASAEAAELVGVGRSEAAPT